MSRGNNYTLQANHAKAGFLAADQEAIIRKLHLESDERYLYAELLSRRYRVNRLTGDLEAQSGSAWVDANSYDEVMTLLDLLCDSREDRSPSGHYLSMERFGHGFHRELLEKETAAPARRFDRDPEALRRACLALKGTPLPVGDVAYAIPFFDGISVAIQFWQGDEDFPPSLRYLWDENALGYLHYETMYFAVSLLLTRLEEKMA